MTDLFYTEMVVRKVLEHDYCEAGDRLYNYLSFCCSTLQSISFPKSMWLYPVSIPFLALHYNIKVSSKVDGGV